MLKKSKKGFTFIEAMIVVAILATIAIILVPMLLSNVDKSAAQKDESAMDEVINAVRLSIAEDDVFDEVLHYSVRNNFLTYTDSDGKYGVHLKDSEFWAPDGSGRATTITFNPVQEGGRWVYNLGNGYVNDMTYGNGSTITPARTMIGCEAYPAQVYFRAMSYNDVTVSSRLYNRIMQSVDPVIEITSHQYEHSSYTVFILFTLKDNMIVATVSGSFNGTNLEASSLAAIGSGTTDYDDDGNPNGDNSGTTTANHDSSDLVGGGHVTYRTYPTYEGDYLDKDKFLAFCATNGSDSITTLRVYASGTSEGVDVSHDGSGTILAWVDGSNMNIGYINPGYQILLPPDSSYLFAAESTGLKNLTTIDMDNSNTQQVENMIGIFQGNKKAEVIAIDGWSCANCVNLSRAFYDCEKVKNIRVAAWNTSNVVDMSYLFTNCGSVTKLNTENWVTTKVQDMKYMFAGCASLNEINVQNFKTSLVESMESMFDGCGSVKKLNIAKFDTSYVKSMKSMFKNCVQLEALDLTGWNTEACTNMAEMFYKCRAITTLDLASFDTSKVQDMSYMFYQCQGIELLDISNFDNLTCPSIACMFDGMVRLEEITLGAKYSFRGNMTDRCYLPEPSSVYIPGANGTWMNDLGQSFPYDRVPSKVAATYYAVDTSTPATLAAPNVWWRGTTSKANIRTIIVMNSYNSTTYDETFNADEENNGGIKVYIEGNVAYIVNMKNKRAQKAFLLPENSSELFAGFINLRTISGLKLINTINVKNMNHFFGDVDRGTACTNLTYASGIESWNLQNLQEANGMFAGVGLRSINLSSWQTPNLKNASQMFYKTAATSINLSGWDVTDVYNFSQMFADNSALTSITLDKWAPVQSANYGNMFANCPLLTTIQASSTFNVNNHSITMFNGDTAIQGNRGTTFVDDTSTFAHVDTDGNPGYFTSSDVQGTMTARLYDTGTVSGSYTELTPAGSTPSAWKFSSGARLLEVNVSQMPRGEQKTVTVSVPTGMYIVSNSWTGVGGDIENVTFKTLDYNASQSGYQQGTGSYSNSQTGTLTYTFPTYATSATIRCLVMFDKTIWNKDKSAPSYGTEYMTIDPPVVVDYNDAIVKRIKNITSATGLGGGATGYSFTLWPVNTSKAFDGYLLKPFGSVYLSASDGSTLNCFWKKVEFTCWAESTNAAGEKIYAKIDSIAAAGTGSKTSQSTEGNIYTAVWDNIYSSGFNFPQMNFKPSTEDGFVVGKTITIKQQVKLTSYSGQVRTGSLSHNFTLVASAVDYNNLIIGGSSCTVPQASYYDDSGLCDVLGVFTIYNNAVANLDNVTCKYVYDSTTAAGSTPVVRVEGANVACPSGITITMQVNLVHEDGTIKGPYSVTQKSKGDYYGCYVGAAQVAAANGLSGKYYVKSVEYTVPSFRGGTTMQYFYSYGGPKNQNSAGTFVGTTTAQGRSTFTISAAGGFSKSTTVYSTPTTSVGYSGYISSYALPMGNTVTAGEEIELDLCLTSCSYPYTITQAFSRPEVYIILPVGVNVEGVIIANSRTSTTSEATPEVTRMKMVEVDGIVSYVYRIRFTQKTWFGYCVAGTNSVTSYSTVSKWVRLSLSTDSSMERTTVMLRPAIYFKDQNGQTGIGGSYQTNAISDPYDVDNDGNTSEQFATLHSNDGDKSIIIKEVE